MRTAMDSSATAVELSEEFTALVSCRTSLGGERFPLGTVLARSGGRAARENPNHHLWHNNGTWFLSCTVHPTPFTKERLRFSLKTRCVETARQRRDEIFAQMECPATRKGAPHFA